MIDPFLRIGIFIVVFHHITVFVVYIAVYLPAYAAAKDLPPQPKPGDVAASRMEAFGSISCNLFRGGPYHRIYIGLGLEDRLN